MDSKHIETKIGLSDYVIDPYSHANFRGNRSKEICSANGRNITHLWLCVPFLSFLCLFFLSSPTAKTDGPIYTIYTSNDVDSPKDVSFGGFDDKKHCSGYQNTQNTPKVGVVRQFQAKSKKNWNCYIFNKVNQINTKFEGTLKTISSPSWVVLETG